MANEDWPDQTVVKPKAEPISDVGRNQGLQAISAMRRFAIFILLAFIAAWFNWLPVFTLTAVSALSIVLVGTVRGLVALGQGLTADKPVDGPFMRKVALATLINGIWACFGALLALASTAGFSRGRQLRRFGHILLPPVEAGGHWTTVSLDPQVDPAVRAGLAAQWRENGRTEHASVAAFARLTLDLMSLGAPPELIADSNRDGLDEIRHTELCFSLAQALDGKTESPGAFPAARSARTLLPGRTPSLASLAVDSLIDGALHEGVSARVIARLAKLCTEPRIREVLKEIAADEGRHAKHGWDVVAWCLEQGGAPVAAALSGALRTIPREMHGELPAEAEAGAWESLGIHGRALEADEYVKARAEVVRRVERLIAGDLAAAA